MTGKANPVTCSPAASTVRLTGWRITHPDGGSCEVVFGYSPQRDSIEIVEVYVTAKCK